MSKLSKIGFLVSGLSLLILIVARVILGGWIDYLYVPLVFTVVGFLAAVIVDYRFYIDFFSMRTTKHGLNMGTLIVGAFALVAAVNYFSARFDKTWDLTAEKLNSLSEQSQKVVDGLPRDVQIKVFYRGEEDREARQQVQQSLQIYLDATSKLDIQFINAFVETAEASEYLRPGDEVKVFAVSGPQKVEIEPPYGENQVTSALIRVTRDTERIIYFLSGHGERDIDQQGNEGISEFKSALESNGFRVAKVNLLRGETLAESEAVLALIGPQTALLDSEIEAIREFMKKGGKLLVAADPGQNHQVANLVKPYGIQFSNNYVINDRTRLLNAGPAAALGLEFSRESDITKTFAVSDQFALFMLASEVTRAEGANTEWAITELVLTEPSAFALNTLRAEVSEKDINRRKHVIGVSSVGKEEGQTSEFGIVVFGDSDFITDRVIFQGINRDLALNSVAFLSKDEGLINVAPKIPEGTQMTMTQTSQMAAVVGGVSLPLLLIVLSGWAWMRRKNL